MSRKYSLLLVVSALLALPRDAFADGIPDISGGAVATVLAFGALVLFIGILVFVQLAKALDRGVDKALEARREKAKQRGLAEARIVRATRGS